MTKDYHEYLKDILNSLNDIVAFTKGMTFNQFIKDKKTSNAVLRSLEVLGEAAKQIPAPLRRKYRNIPWKNMTGMRDKLIHEYFGVDLVIVWQTLKNDLPSLEVALKDMIRDFNKEYKE
jgi:uncharacterized protein with HEPN domain